MNNGLKSTYALVLRSEEKGRTIMEIVVYALCIVSAVLAIWQFIEQSAQLSLDSIVPPEHSGPMASQQVMQVDLQAKS